MKVTIECENILIQALREGVNLFLGSGFSVLAKDAEGRPLPINIELKKEIVDTFKKDEYAELSVDKISTILKSQSKDKFNEFLKKRFYVTKYDTSYESLYKLKLMSILTTNIDNLIYKLYENCDVSYINDVTKRGSIYNDKNAINYIPLHGCVLDETPNYIFGTTELASAFASDRDKWHYLTNAIQQYPTIFWGYSLSDSGVLEALHPATTNMRPRNKCWIIVNDDRHNEYYKALGMNIIYGDTSSLLNYFKDLELKPVAQISKPTFSAKEIFPEYAIPNIGGVPQRPLLNFYSGEPPIWGDIFSGRIHKTKYYDILSDKILGENNVIVVGIPGCGKTTLMMQLASGIQFQGHKLVCNDLTLEKAVFIIKKLNNEKALIFVDDICNDVNAFQHIIKSKNIIAVGFEREYNYEIASHRLENIANIIDVTELDKKDVQSIFDCIPSEIKLKQLTTLNDEESDISIFELIQLNTKLPNIKDRFIEVINQLETANHVLADILTMLSYLHSCRTPVSIDILFAFLRSKTTNYVDIYNYLDKLGEMIKDYEIESVIAIDEKQDYFIPRSTILAEAVMSAVPHHILKRVIVTFHNEVSPFRIFRYDRFRVKGYDSNIMRKVFVDCREGKAFYEKAYSADSSPYLRQQGALYLAKMKNYDDAFKWIDEALMQSNFKIFSIRNSHAIILFQANINKDIDDPTVKETLDNSMKILSECHDADKRKLYHALKYSDQAIQYYKKFNDKRAREYLCKAKEWLLEEKQKGIKIRSIENLLRQVNKLIQ